MLAQRGTPVATPGPTACQRPGSRIGLPSSPALIGARSRIGIRSFLGPVLLPRRPLPAITGTATHGFSWTATGEDAGLSSVLTPSTVVLGSHPVSVNFCQRRSEMGVA